MATWPTCSSGNDIGALTLQDFATYIDSTDAYIAAMNRKG